MPRINRIVKSQTRVHDLKSFVESENGAFIMSRPDFANNLPEYISNKSSALFDWKIGWIESFGERSFIWIERNMKFKTGIQVAIEISIKSICWVKNAIVWYWYPLLIWFNDIARRYSFERIGIYRYMDSQEIHIFVWMQFPDNQSHLDQTHWRRGQQVRLIWDQQ